MEQNEKCPKCGAMPWKRITEDLKDGDTVVGRIVIGMQYECGYRLYRHGEGEPGYFGEDSIGCVRRQLAVKTRALEIAARDAIGSGCAGCPMQLSKYRPLCPGVTLSDKRELCHKAMREFMIAQARAELDAEKAEGVKSNDQA